MNRNQLLCRLASVSGLWILLLPAAAAANPLAKQPGGWAGSYSNPQGMQLTLGENPDGVYSGELSIEAGSGRQVFPVDLQKAPDARLNGEFRQGSVKFPLSVSRGEEPDQIVLISEGNVYELSRDGAAANPLAGTASPRTRVATPAGTKRFEHPDGYFDLEVPSQWVPVMHAPDVLQFDTGKEQQVVLVLIAALEPDEIGKPLPQLVPSAIEAVDAFLFGPNSQPESGGVDSVPTSVGQLPGAISKRTASDGFNRFSIWQGTVASGDSAVLLVATAGESSDPKLFASMDSMFDSMRLLRAPDHRALANPPRNVVFNGERLNDEKLRLIEGDATGLIPDGGYWYDRKTGMVGQQDGPTLAYLAADLDLCPPIAADASGGLTRVALNGRYLHPDDLAGLEYYFGPIQPNRYWMDSMGNYGVEGGQPLGNLLQQIAAIQAMAAAYPGGQSGGQGQGGYGGGGGGGSVYQHFPNLGAGGTGVGVADLGGGDTIVNAGGVMWWPGK